MFVNLLLETKSFCNACTQGIMQCLHQRGYAMHAAKGLFR